TLEHVKGHRPARMDAAEQDELGDWERRIDRLDIVEHALHALVAGAAERDQVGRRVVPRQAERDDVVHLKVPGPSAAGAEGRLPERSLADRFPSRAAPADARRPAQMALVAGPRAEPSAGVGATRQDRPGNVKRAPAGRAAS